jgi:ankyrin repeat protein
MSARPTRPGLLDSRAALAHDAAMSIHEAAARGDLPGIVAALDAGAGIDAPDPFHGRTPLMAAAASEHAGLAAVRLLVERGADLNARAWTPATAPAEPLAEMDAESAAYRFTGDTALTLAAARGDMAVVSYLLDAGADVGAATTHGYDALINAVFAGARHDRETASLVALLLRRGASPHGETSYRETALRAAAGFALFDVVALLLGAGADEARLGWGALMRAVVFGTPEEVRAALESGAEIEARDPWGRTALHLALQTGDLEKIRALRAAGAALASGAHDGHSPLGYAIRPSHPAALAWLLAEGCDPDAPDSYGATPLAEAAEAGDAEAVRLLLTAGARVDRADQYGELPIARATRPEVVRLLLAAGADLNGVADEMRLALFGLPAETTIPASREEYLAGKGRRFGASNPERLDIPFWNAMVRARAPAYSARMQFDPDERYGEPVWCFKRFGRTLTALPDGRYVEVGGEHEDFYDPDFCIYNDVVVYDGAGGFAIYAYPEAIFPPTDFHSATLVGDDIYLIGSLGYQGARRFGQTPVYRLSWRSWRIEPVATSGQQPGWISRHTAVYDAATGRIVVSGGKRSVRRREPVTVEAGGRAGRKYALVERYEENGASYALDLATATWRRLRR